VPTYPSSLLYPSGTTYPGDVLDPEAVAVVAHVRDRPPLRESTEVVTPSGKRYRWASDEPQAENVPRDERWSDIMPGGFETLDQTLPRKPSIDYSDLERLSRITRYDASGNVIWQGRLERAPRVSGDQMAISPSAVGYQAHLEDDKSVKEVYIDRDLSGWGEATAPRRLALAGVSGGLAMGWSNSVIGAGDTGGIPALVMELQSLTANGTSSREVGEFWYNGQGVALGSLTYSVNGSEAGADANWITVAVLSTDDIHTATDTGTDHNGGDASNQTVTATADNRTWATFQARYTANSTADGTWYQHWQRPTVFGNHGLTKRGAAPDQGFYDGDVIGHALSRWCPSLSYTSESLISDSFVIPHLAFKDPTTVGEIIKQATRFRLRDWAVWEGPLFWLHDRNARGTKWRARVGPTQLEETGPQVDRLWNSIIVQYQDVDGSTRTVGPTGSGVDTESAYLLDDDPENPANKAGIIRRDLLTMGVSTPEGAIEVGRRFLEQSKQLDSSGRARIVGHVQDDRGVWHPYSHVRAGDQIAFVDASDSGYRRIVKTDKSRSDRSCSIDLDAPPEGLQALLERLGVVLVPLGL
jgi:hypothetical protein